MLKKYLDGYCKSCYNKVNKKVEKREWQSHKKNTEVDEKRKNAYLSSNEKAKNERTKSECCKSCYNEVHGIKKKVEKELK